MEAARHSWTAGIPLQSLDPAEKVESRAGLLISLAFATVILTWLNMIVIEPPIDLPKPQLKIVLRPAPQPAPVPETPPAPVTPEVPQLAATSANPSDSELFRDDAVKGEPESQEVAQEVPKAVPLSRWRPRDNAERQAMEQVRLQVADARDRLERERNDLKSKLHRYAVESAGKEFLLNSDGGRTGIIRTFNTEGFSDDIVMPILNRYGITVEYRHVGPETSRKFLNAAVTEKGTYRNVDREGFYEVFSLSTKAVSMLAAMESTALMEKGHDPLRTRILRIEFGIIKNERDEFDLGVTDLETEQIR